MVPIASLWCPALFIHDVDKASALQPGTDGDLVDHLGPRPDRWSNTAS
ncbi:hypothetical protein ACTWPB_13065 [Nocardia sp. IBHARD005]